MEPVQAHSSRAHARLSPSSAHRWAECPGSVAAEEGLPSRSSAAADEGTAAHELVELCLRARLDADAYLGQWIDLDANRFTLAKPGHARAFLITEAMAEACQVYLDYVRPLYDGAEVEVEAKLDLSHIPGMEFGTGDFCAYHSETMTLDIVDFKYGRGVLVEPAEDGKPNPQLGAYALGRVKRYHNRGVKRVRLTVVQPRAYHVAGVIRTAEFDALDLMGFEDWLTERAEATQAPDAPRKAGDWCRFCAAKGVCDTYADAAMAVARDTFGSLADPVDLTPDEMAAKLKSAHMLRAWLKAFEEYAHEQALLGNMPTGFKLVPKRAVRQWAGDSEKLSAELALWVDDVKELWTQPELKSPAQVEALMPGRNKKERAAALAPFVQLVSPGTKLVPVDDPRSSARPEAAEVFERADADHFG